MDFASLSFPPFGGDGMYFSSNPPSAGLAPAPSSPPRHNHTTKSKKSSGKKSKGSPTPGYKVKNVWTPEEDAILRELVAKHGEHSWTKVAEGLERRVGKQCRDRWTNHLAPKLDKNKWTPELDEILFQAVEKIGKSWAEISRTYLVGRSDLSIKNRYYSTIRKRERTILEGALSGADATRSGKQSREGPKPGRAGKRAKSESASLEPPHYFSNPFGTSLQGSPSLSSSSARQQQQQQVSPPSIFFSHNPAGFPTGPLGLFPGDFNLPRLGAPSILHTTQGAHSLYGGGGGGRSLLSHGTSPIGSPTRGMSPILQAVNTIPHDSIKGFTLPMSLGASQQPIAGPPMQPHHLQLPKFPHAHFFSSPPSTSLTNSPVPSPPRSPKPEVDERASPVSQEQPQPLWHGSWAHPPPDLGNLGWSMYAQEASGQISPAFPGAEHWLQIPTVQGMTIEGQVHGFGALPGFAPLRQRQGKWTPEEHQRFEEGLAQCGANDWAKIAKYVQTRDVQQVRRHAFKLKHGGLPDDADDDVDDDIVVEGELDALAADAKTASEALVSISRSSSPSHHYHHHHHHRTGTSSRPPSPIGHNLDV